MSDPEVWAEDVLDDEAVESDIAEVIEDWYERGHDVFDTDEVCAAYVQGYKTGHNAATVSRPCADEVTWLHGIREAACQPPIEAWLLVAIQERLKALVS